MSTQVDQRVVEMRFDNRKFEQNVSTTMSTLEKLKQSLNLTGASKGLEEVNAAAKKCDVSGIGSAVETVRAKFSALEVMGVTALANITNSAINAGKKMISALTIDPIKTGFSEYETKMGAIQTIMSNTASKGTTMEDVTRVIDELNTYADKTIYNFAEMTRNIGTFTAAGVGLEESASAIQGIANLAAASGSTSQQASTAMYQLSQALSSGTVKLMDWNSVVNAGMGGEKFQEALKATARDHGVAVDSIIKKNGSFRESLQEGWITADILNETLNKFTVDGAKNYARSMMESGKWTQEQADALMKEAQSMEDAATKVKTFTQLCDTLKESAQSGWGKTWELIVGDFDEAKELFTNLSNIFGGLIDNMSDARNNLLEGALASNWQKVAAQVTSAGLSTADLKDSLKEIAKKNGVSIDSLIEEYGSFEKSLKAGWLTTGMLSEALTGQTDKFTQLSDAELTAKGYTEDEIKAMRDLAEQAKNTDGSLDELVAGMTKIGGRELLIESLMNVLKGLGSVLKPIGQAFREVFPAMTVDQLYGLIEKFRDFTAKLTLTEQQSAKLKSTFKGVFSVFSIGAKVVTSFVKGLTNLVGAILPIGDGILSVTGSFGDFLSGINETVGSANIFGVVFGVLEKIISPVANAITNALNSMASGVDRLGGIIGVLAAVAKGIAYAFSKIKDAVSETMTGFDFNATADAINSGLLGGLLIGLQRFVGSLKKAVENGPGIIAGIRDIKDAIVDTFGALQTQLKAGALLKIASAIGILAASLVVLSLIDKEKLTTALVAITSLFVELFGSMAIFEKLAGGKGFDSIGKISRAMLTLSLSVFILAGAMKMVSSLSWNELGVGLTAIAAGLGMLIGAVWLLPDKKANDAAKTIKKLSSSLLILSVALKIMGSMSWNELGVALAAMAVGLGALVGAVHLLPKNTAAKAGGVLILASAMVVLSTALKIMGSMEWSELKVGLTAMGVGLGILVGALHLLPKDVLGKASSVLVLASAMVVLGAALKIMGSMSWDEIGRGLGVLAGSLLILVLALNKVQGNIAGAAALLVVSSAIVALSVALKMLGSMSIGEVVTSLITLAAALAIIGVAAAILSPITPAILALGAGVALLGIGCLAAGAGILALSAGLTALAVAFTASGGAIIGAIQSLIGLIPTLATAIGAGIVAMAVAIGNGASAIVGAISKILVALLQAVIDVAPKLGEAAVVLITTFLDAIIKTAPKAVETILVVLEAILNGIVDFVPKIVVAGLKLITGLLQGIANNIGKVVSSAVEVMTAFMGAIGQETPKLVDAGFKMMIDFINGVADSCRENIPLIMDAVGNLATSIIDGLKQGIMDGVGKIGGAFKELAEKGLGKFKKILGINSPSKEFREQGGYIVQGLTKGLKDNTPDAVHASEKLGMTMLNGMQDALGIHSPSVVFDKKVGRYIVQGIAEGIKKDMSAEEAAEKKAQNIVSAFQKALNAYDLDTAIAEKKLTIWKQGDGKNASDDDIDTKDLAYLNDELSRKLSKQTLAYDEWQETVKYFGESSDKAKEALKKYLDAQIAVAGIQEEITTVENRSMTRQYDALEDATELRDAYYKLWEASNADTATNAQKDARYLTYLNENLASLTSQQTLQVQGYNKAVNEYGKESEEALAALKKCLATDIEIIETRKAIAQVSMDSMDKEIDALEIAATTRAKERSLWSAMYGEDATDAEKDEKNISWLNEDLETLNSKLLIAQRKYNTVVSKYGSESEEARDAWDYILDLQTDIARTRNEITQINKDAIDRERASLEEQYELMSRNAELQYQIWEQTTGRKASSADKNAAKVSMLTKQLSAQTSILQLAYTEWQEAAKKYGEYSNEAQSKYSDYLSKQLDLANLQNEITDINESTVEKQKLARSDYKDYLEKYEKYYLKNGMSREDLERDARLVSGYDPNATVTSLIDNTDTALQNIQDSALYSDLMTNLNSLGSSYVTAVSDGIQNETSAVEITISDMLSKCLDTIRGKYAEWKDAAKYLVSGFITGIQDSIEEAVRAAVELAAAVEAAVKAELEIYSPSKVFVGIGKYAVMGLAQGLTNNSGLSEDAATILGRRTLDSLKSSISKISEAVKEGIDAEPTIRPVLDLSNVRSKLTSLNTMMSRAQAMRINAAMSDNHGGESQNGNDTASNNNTYNFTQNNYSPKALSRIDIYRQTKNQFAAMKGALS